MNDKSVSRMRITASLPDPGPALGNVVRHCVGLGGCLLIYADRDFGAADLVRGACNLLNVPLLEGDWRTVPPGADLTLYDQFGEQPPRAQLEILQRFRNLNKRVIAISSIQVYGAVEGYFHHTLSIQRPAPITFPI